MSRRALAIGFFALVALAELGDLAGLVITLGNPTAAAAMLGITPRAETIRAIILLALAVLVALNALLALAGAATRQPLLTQFGGLMAGVGLAAYGIYQAGSALFQHGRLLYGAVGLVYMALAGLAFWLARAPAPRPKQA